MATIYKFERSFDVRNTHIKYKALDLACAQLGPAGRSHSVRKVIARRILKAMEKGDRDPARLCTIGLAALGPMIIDPATLLARAHARPVSYR
jgi:hypothetical protein